MGERWPGAVPDDGPVDTDGDGLGDTVVRPDGSDLVLLTDLDGDGLADRLLRIGPDGVVREAAAPLLDGWRGGVLGALLGSPDL